MNHIALGSQCSNTRLKPCKHRRTQMTAANESNSLAEAKLSRRKRTRLTRRKKRESGGSWGTHECLQMKQKTMHQRQSFDFQQKGKGEINESPQLQEKRRKSEREHGGGERSPPWWCHMITRRQERTLRDDAEIKGQSSRNAAARPNEAEKYWTVKWKQVCDQHKHRAPTSKLQKAKETERLL